jgi:hypothetical protein
VFQSIGKLIGRRVAVPSSSVHARIWPAAGCRVQSRLAAEYERSWAVRSIPTRRRVASIQSSITKILEHLHQEQAPRGEQGHDTEHDNRLKQATFSRRRIGAADPGADPRRAKAG